LAPGRALEPQNSLELIEIIGLYTGNNSKEENHFPPTPTLSRWEREQERGSNQDFFLENPRFRADGGRGENKEESLFSPLTPTLSRWERG